MRSTYDSTSRTRQYKHSFRSFIEPFFISLLFSLSGVISTVPIIIVILTNVIFPNMMANFCLSLCTDGKLIGNCNLLGLRSDLLPNSSNSVDTVSFQWFAFQLCQQFFPQKVHLNDLENRQRSEGQRVQIEVYLPPRTSVSFFSTDEERIGLEAAPVVRPGPLPEVGRDRSGDSRHSDVVEPKRQDRFRLRPPLVEGPEREI